MEESEERSNELPEEAAVSATAVVPEFPSKLRMDERSGELPEAVPPTLMEAVPSTAAVSVLTVVPVPPRRPRMDERSREPDVVPDPPRSPRMDESEEEVSPLPLGRTSVSLSRKSRSSQVASPLPMLAMPP